MQCFKNWMHVEYELSELPDLKLIRSDGYMILWRLVRNRSAMHLQVGKLNHQINGPGSSCL
ncbi:hypothetical protein DAI22_05g220100 [Oryza sativa Japonica Group]|nr:hypothetical protein DAI22_05g220100 [Oryza sativa Japonica Group]